jgi:hypothetical protein
VQRFKEAEHDGEHWHFWNVRAVIYVPRLPKPTVDLGTPEHFGSRHIGSNLAGTAAALEWFLELRLGYRR